VADTPFEPGTIVTVFSLSFHWWTDATWIASVADTKL